MVFYELFPSPIYGASFKLYLIFLSLKDLLRFRPLYTGLVSNQKGLIIMTNKYKVVSVPYIRG